VASTDGQASHEDRYSFGVLEKNLGRVLTDVNEETALF
jgi:hypothetical protein